MACSNNNCSNCSSCSSCSRSSNCGCFGTLNCVAGPLTHCGCCTSNAQYYQDYPFYTGPCGSVNCCGCGCSSSRNKWWNRCGCSGNWSGWSNGWNSGCNHGCCCATVSHCCSNLSGTSAHFTADAPLMVAAGGMVNLSPLVSNSDWYSCADGGILIRRPGTYMAIYTVQAPAMQSLSTRMFLSLNGNFVEGSHQDVAAIADGTVNGSTAHIIFHALPNSLLRLMSTEEISLPSSCEEASSAFKLTLIRLN